MAWNGARAAMDKEQTSQTNQSTQTEALNTGASDTEDVEKEVADALRLAEASLLKAEKGNKNK